jgi:hypothetical protein
MKLLISRLLALAALCVIVLISSCSSDGEEPQPASEVTFLKVGTKYTMYYDDGFWNVDSLYTEVSKQLATDTFLVRNSSPTIAVAGTQYWVLKDNNFYTSIRLRDPNTYQIECKFNQPVGTSWNVTKNGVSYVYTIEELNATVTTGDGPVTDAVKIKITSGNQSAFQFISPTVGMLGNGSVSEDVVAKVIHYKVGTTAPVTKNLPKITFGNFPFLKVNNYWDYVESNIVSEVDVNTLVESKLPSSNIYKVKVTYDGTPSYSYWYEDAGMLMVYEEGEEVVEADPIYMSTTIAEVGYGWAGLTSTNSMFIYNISEIGEVYDTFFGELPCVGIDVSNGLFTSQTNYWNQNKGNVFVSGFVSRELTDSNARAKKKMSILPIPVL